jgi:hypothetical protein
MGLKYVEWHALVEDLRTQWHTMWRERIDDKELAEGITNRAYYDLFVEEGTVIMASRDYRPPDFEEIVERHRPGEAASQGLSPHPLRGGYGKFIRDVIVNQQRYGLVDRHQTGRTREAKEQTKQQPLKKGGRGWLHAAR